jgi:hypothetical protein
MEALIERAAGLDVHQGSVVACVILGAAGRRPTKEVRSFGTMREDLMALREWLLEKGVIPVALFADLIDRLGDPGIAGERGETPGFVT